MAGFGGASVHAHGIKVQVEMGARGRTFVDAI